MANDSYSRSIAQILTNDSFRKRTAYQSGSSAHVKNVDFLARENAREHHTDKFHLVNSELQTPIFRRGQAFSLQIDFSSLISFLFTDKTLRLDFLLGSDPSPGRGTLIHLQVADSPDFTFVNNWGVRVKSMTDDSLTLEVKPAASAPIGVWMLSVVTQPGNNAFQVPQHMYILFNPWSRDDHVYMENEDLLNEYILNDTGTIYIGESKKILHKSWSYNQFFAVAVPAAMYALECAALPYGNRGNPIGVSRAISCMGRHILLGNWTGDYHNGVSPLLWQTSNAILEQYMNEKSEVKYGQSWVFAAITNTLCRAIGLPCRVVTCFQASHDAEKNITLDRYFDDYDRKVESCGCIWNFHVWDDVWMTRPDLPEGYGGWQAIDSTPQNTFERSNLYECGPSSLVAIKNGEIGTEYSTMFIFSQVNADLLTWKKNYFGIFQIISINEKVCGKSVVTKAAGRNEMEEVTLQYKFGEGTQEERMTMDRAAKISFHEDRVGSNQVETITANNDVFLNIHPVKSVLIGDAVQIAVQVENRSLQPRIVDLSVSAQSVMYTGTKGEEFDISGEGNGADKTYKQTVELAPNQREIVTLSITSSMYGEHLREMGYINILSSASVRNTTQVWFQEDTVMAMTPEIKIEMPEEMKQGLPCTIKLSFTNPLPRELTECSFSIASNCILKTTEVQFRNVAPKEEVIHQIDITPDITGQCLIMAQFSAKNLAEISGSKYTTVV